ncbi:hypothetical protein BG95_09030 [Thermosipho sp. 1063]|uniref:type III-A CRISPR-associated protein Cas10/Csm1 n=1 Tax=unclassified Thermosipho (in: thermotogales) TaxID=2676525 RepID=UPI00094931E0|nr:MULTISPECIES: type III-A CRISPR-associated protein Cas10/Csm1 [unclassified Thermosipho (in: thermotogales)]ANQ54699.1 hypothetical protein Y592_09135 [Thermosipho sp. 1070]APT73087.1 hypothetical protein BG95_09030 [Thermosipho sp. 1063]OOC42407.1 hypothetical protein XO08_09075 [Thermosipho sp. 1074]
MKEREQIVVRALTYGLNDIINNNLDFLDKKDKLTYFDSKTFNEKIDWYISYVDSLLKSDNTPYKFETSKFSNLENIFSKVFNENIVNNELVFNTGKNSFFEPFVISDLLSSTSDRELSQEKIKKVFYSFEKDLKILSDSLNPNSLETMIKKHFSFVPYLIFSKKVVDVSYYDYRKVSAMLSLCLYDYTDGKITSFGDLQNLDEKETFLLIGGDVSGIQKFISKVSSKGALRSYRGRSFFIELLQEIIVNELLEQTEFYRVNIHFIGGGHFYLVLSNTEKNKNILKKIQQKVNNWFIENNLDLSIVMEYVSFKPSDVKNMNVVFSKLAHKINEKKNRLFSDFELEKLFKIRRNGNNMKTCKVCGALTTQLFSLRADEEEIACNFCRTLYNIGKELMDNKKKYIVLTNKNEEDVFEIFGKKYKFSSIPEKVGFKIKESYKFDNNDKNLIRLEVLAYSSTQSLTEMAKNVPGKKLAALKVDVDNLGKIFREGLALKTLIRISALSRLLS